MTSYEPQYQHACPLHCSLHISDGTCTSWENLLKHQDILFLVIISFSLITCVFDQVVIL